MGWGAFIFPDELPGDFSRRSADTVGDSSRGDLPPTGARRQSLARTWASRPAYRPETCQTTVPAWSVRCASRGPSRGPGDSDGSVRSRVRPAGRAWEDPERPHRDDGCDPGRRAGLLRRRCRGENPNLDRLVAQGARFTNCTSASPIGLPAHCTIFTSTWPLVHGVRRDHGTRLTDPNETLAEMLARAGYQTAAIPGSPELPETSGLNQGFAVYAAGQESEGAPGAELTGPRGDRSGNRAAAGRSKKGPFFIWANYHDPGFPFSSPPYSGAGIAEAYAKSVTSMDAEVGRLVKGLDDAGLGEKTIVVVVGAHGERLGEHGERGHGCFLYESTLHVPLLLRCPGRIPKGRVVEQRVRTIDLLPTILDYLGRPAAPLAQGRTLRPLMQRKEIRDDRPAFAETDMPADAFGLASLRSLSTDEWKYIDSPDPELYNLAQDPGEGKNLAADRPEILDSMRKQLSSALVAAAQTETGEDRGIDAQRTGPRAAEIGWLHCVPQSPDIAEARSRPDSSSAPRAHVEAISRYAEARNFISKGEYGEAEAALRAVLSDLPALPIQAGTSRCS